MCGPDTTRSERTLCAYPNCRRTVWQDANGVFSSYCGASHRDAMANKLSSGSLCQVCKIFSSFISHFLSDSVIVLMNLVSIVSRNRDMWRMVIVGDGRLI